jgi:hypothetical protein
VTLKTTVNSRWIRGMNEPHLAVLLPDLPKFRKVVVAEPDGTRHSAPIDLLKHDLRLA